MQRLKLDPHLHAQLGVKVGERFVEQEHLRLFHDGPANGDPLALAARQLAGLAVKVGFQLQNAGSIGNPALAVGLGEVVDLHPEIHVLSHRHVRVQRVGLEHHRNVAVAGGNAGHLAVADVDRAARNLLQPRDGPQKRGLAAARRADENREFAIRNVQRDGMQRLCAAVELVDA